MRTSRSAEFTVVMAVSEPICGWIRSVAPRQRHVARLTDMSRSAGSISGFVATIVMIVTLGACGVPQALRPSLRDAPTHERYAAALSEFGLDRVALGQDWLAAASLALTQPLVASTPFAEKGHLPAERPTAVGYRFELERGRRFAIDVAYETSQPGRLF